MYGRTPPSPEPSAEEVLSSPLPRHSEGLDDHPAGRLRPLLWGEKLAGGHLESLPSLAGEVFGVSTKGPPGSDGHSAPDQLDGARRVANLSGPRFPPW